MKIEVGDIVRFVDVHHMMNPGLKGHKGDKAKVTDLNRSHDNSKVQVEFIEGSSKDPLDRWTVKPSRLEVLEKKNGGAE